MEYVVPLSWPLLVSFITFFILLYKSRIAGRSSAPLPPGPPRKLFIGNLLDLPRHEPWIKFTEWKKQYGDLVYLKVMGKHVLVLNNLTPVNCLLGKRASNYSDRPIFTMVGELMGLDNSMPMLPYDSLFKHHRKLSRMALGSEAVRKYYSIQENATALFIRSLLVRPENFVEDLRLAAGRIIMGVTYGFAAMTADDPYIAEAEAAMKLIGESSVPGAFLVDLVPALKYIPQWVPFNKIHQVGHAGRRLIYSMVDRPFHRVQQEIENGSTVPSFTADCLAAIADNEPKLSQPEIHHIVRWVAGALYGAGGESTYATVLSFILAMTQFPDVQRKIKEELDRVVGNKLPVVGDRQNLPYLNATIKEALRWHPALPLSIARRTRAADIYDGYYVPGGTIVVPNVWAIAIDEETGIPTEKFAPERFLSEHVQQTATDPYSYAFGFGRRECPGKFLGDNNLFYLISWLVSTVEIVPASNEAGNPVQINPAYMSGLVSYPEPFKVQFIPRGGDASVYAKLAKEVQ